MMSPWVVHRDSRWYTEPEQFRPERWPRQDSSRPKFSYFPLAEAPASASASALRGWKESYCLRLSLSDGACA